MQPTEQPEFFRVLNATMGAYGKFPSPQELGAWWRECERLTLDAVEAALKSHRDDPDRGERAPRPVDITRRMKAGGKDAQRCSARDSIGQCEYPGIFSDATQGEGQWWCPLHRLERSGEEANRRIEYARKVPWTDYNAKRLAKRAADTVRAPSVVETAHAIALRHGNRPWQARVAEFIPDSFRREEAA